MRPPLLRELRAHGAGAAGQLAAEPLLRATAQDAGGRGRQAGQQQHRRGPAPASPARLAGPAWASWRSVAGCSCTTRCRASPMSSRTPTRPCGWRRCRPSRSWEPRAPSPCWTGRSMMPIARSAWRPSAASGTRGYKGALRRIEAVVLGKSVESRSTSPRRWRSSRPMEPLPGAAGLKALSYDSAPARPAQDERAAGNPGLRGHGPGPDQDRRGSRAASAGRRRQGAGGPQRREPRPAGAAS